MVYQVLKPFTWNGKELLPGFEVKIEDDNSRIGALVRSKFIRLKLHSVGSAVDALVTEDTEPADKLEPTPVVEGEPSAEANAPVKRGPKEIVREAKQKASGSHPEVVEEVRQDGKTSR